MNNGEKFDSENADREDNLTPSVDSDQRFWCLYLAIILKRIQEEKEEETNGGTNDSS